MWNDHDPTKPDSHVLYVDANTYMAGLYLKVYSMKTLCGMTDL